MTKLSNGNLAFAISSTNAVSSIGIYYGVYTTVGVQVSAVAQLGTVSNANFPQIIAGVNYFAVTRANGNDQKVWVLSNRCFAGR